MSYVIDVYRGILRPQKSYFEYLSFVAFFPHLVAGPIVRPRDLLPQLAGKARWNATEASEGLFLVAVGLLKKVAIGDYLAINLIDRVFDAPTHYSALECYAAVLAYAVQIYTDFSGYTDIAIGTALLLGVRMPLNFNAPYKAPEIIDFWRRWHISLSTWLRDYLYISLGGNRHGPVRTYFNLMVTMLLGGLWHGASWSFVVWGGLHGWALAVTRAVGEASGARRKLVALAAPALVAGPLLGSVMCLLLGAWDSGVALRFTLLGWLLGAALALGALHRAWQSGRRASRGPEEQPPAAPGSDRIQLGAILCGAGVLSAVVTLAWRPAVSLGVYAISGAFLVAGVVLLARGLRLQVLRLGLPQVVGRWFGRKRLLAAAFTAVSVLGTYHVVCAGWVYFRAASFQDAALFFSQLMSLSTHHPNLQPLVLALLVTGMLTHWMPHQWYVRVRQAFIRAPAPLQGVVLFLAALAVREMASAEAVPFVYFQF
jgi:D-alanyl-lipoteichoic acid acyltransferase DltB (MBOAT superfamily)